MWLTFFTLLIFHGKCPGKNWLIYWTLCLIFSQFFDMHFTGKPRIETKVTNIRQVSKLLFSLSCSYSVSVFPVPFWWVGKNCPRYSLYEVDILTVFKCSSLAGTAVTGFFPIWLLWAWKHLWNIPYAYHLYILSLRSLYTLQPHM